MKMKLYWAQFEAVFWSQNQAYSLIDANPDVFPKKQQHWYQATTQTKGFIWINYKHKHICPMHINIVWKQIFPWHWRDKQSKKPNANISNNLNLTSTIIALNFKFWRSKLHKLLKSTTNHSDFLTNSSTIYLNMLPSQLYLIPRPIFWSPPSLT